MLESLFLAFLKINDHLHNIFKVFDRLKGILFIRVANPFYLIESFPSFDFRWNYFFDSVLRANRMRWNFLALRFIIFFLTRWFLLHIVMLFSFSMMVKNFAAVRILLALWKGHDLILIANLRLTLRRLFYHMIRNWWIVLSLNLIFFRSYIPTVYWLLMILWIFMRLFKFWWIWMEILLKIKADKIILWFSRIVWRLYFNHLWRS